MHGVNTPTVKQQRGITFLIAKTASSKTASGSKHLLYGDYGGAEDDPQGSPHVQLAAKYGIDQKYIVAAGAVDFSSGVGKVRWSSGLANLGSSDKTRANDYLGREAAKERRDLERMDGPWTTKDELNQLILGGIISAVFMEGKKEGSFELPNSEKMWLELDLVVSQAQAQLNQVLQDNMQGRLMQLQAQQQPVQQQQQQPVMHHNQGDTAEDEDLEEAIRLSLLFAKHDEQANSSTVSPSPIAPLSQAIQALISRFVRGNEMNMTLNMSYPFYQGSDIDADLKEVAKRCPNLHQVFLGYTSVTDAGLQDIAVHCGEKLETIILTKTRVTDAGLKEAAPHMENLKNLCLWGTRVTDTGLKEVAAHCNRLTHIDLHQTKVTVSSLKELTENCPNLKKLELQRTGITDACLKEFAAHCKELQEMFLEGTKVTDAGLQDTSKLLPACKFYNTWESGYQFGQAFRDQ